MVPCYSRMVALGKCTGPAMIAMTTTQYIENTSVIESMYIIVGMKREYSNA